MTPLFQASGPLPANQPTHIQRQADRQALHGALNGDYLHIIAPRQMGKTSLLKRLAICLDEKGWRCAYVDLSILMDLPKSVWYTELGKILAKSLTPGQLPQLNNQIDLRRYLLNQALPWFNGQPNVALFFDEVEGAGKAQDTNNKPFSDTFFMTLRNLYIQREDYPGTLVVALAGAINPGDLVTDPDISPFNIGQALSLDDFTTNEALALTSHLTQLGLPVDDSVHQTIYNWTNGHPYLTQRVCMELEKNAHISRWVTLTPDHVNNVIERFILTPDNPMQQDKNLQHASRDLSRLSAPAATFWSRLRFGEAISRRELTDDTYLELYLTGVIKVQNDYLVIRNRIYETALRCTNERFADYHFDTTSPVLDTQQIGALPMITWLHLSDIHFREAQAYNSNIVLQALLSDVEKQKKAGLHPDFIIFSGDVAHAGQSKEYALARQFFDDLLNVTELDKDRLFLIPGNHDVDRSAISLLAKSAVQTLADRDTVNTFLADEGDRELIFKRFRHYREFISDYLGAERIPFDNTHYFYVRQITLSGLRIAILGLNSAWLCASDQDRNQLILGERQVRAALDQAKDAHLCLAVMHHPFDWLKDFDRNDVEPLLCRKCDFVLHGHMHQTGLRFDRTPDTEAILIAAGACYETRQYPNSYNVVQLDFQEGKGVIHLRMYSDKSGGFWAKDVVNYHNVEGDYSFPLSNRLQQTVAALGIGKTAPGTGNNDQGKIGGNAQTGQTGGGSTETPGTDPETSSRTVVLRRLLTERLSLEELNTLCFDLGIDYESLGGAGKAARVRELVRYLEQRKHLQRLETWLRQNRPDITLP